jgi:hypothetical protein
MGPREERRLAQALLLVLVVNVTVVAVMAMTQQGPEEAPVGGDDDGSSGKAMGDGGFMPRGGKDNHLGEPDEVYEGVEGPVPEEDG